MYRVSQSFWIYNGRKLNEPIEDLYIGPVEKRSFMVVRSLPLVIAVIPWDMNRL